MTKRQQEERATPIAQPGDMPFGKSYISSMSKDGFERNWRQVGKLTLANKQELLVAKCNTAESEEINYLVGQWVEREVDGVIRQVLDVVLMIDLGKSSGVGRKFGYPNLWYVSNVTTSTNMQSLGIATAMYRFLLKKESINLLSDLNQYFGARRLWAKLSKQLDLRVDIIDTIKGVILEENVRLNQGKLDEEFDQRAWAHDPSKGHIRLILIDLL